jgi:hypothetical protein
VNEEQRLARLQKQVGTSEPIAGGCYVQRHKDPSLTDVSTGIATVDLAVTAVAVTGAAIAGLVRRARKQSPPPNVDRLPDGPLALAVVGDEVLVGRGGKVLRRFPANEVLPTIARPRLAGEITLDGEVFEAETLQGDYLLRLKKLSP